jgi:hypothetical protein
MLQSLYCSPCVALALLIAPSAVAPAAAQCPDPAAGNHFSRYVNVMGVHLFATPAVGDTKLEHAAGVLARYLDSDQDGVADDPAVLATLVANKAAMFMFGNENDAQAAFNDDDLMDSSLTFQDLFADETVIGYPASTNQFDFALEEVLHLVTSVGWAGTYASVFGEQSGSTLALAMDTARGGHFEESGGDQCDGGTQCALPLGGYPPGAWYTYDDETCDYRCMATEYIYWALTSLLGGQQAPGRPGDIADEWQLATPAQVQSDDTAIYDLLTAQGYALPTVLPDGNYGPGVGPAGDNPCDSDPGPGQDDYSRCAKTLRKMLTKYPASGVKNLGKCVNGVNRGKTVGPCPDAKTQNKLDRAADNVSADKIDTACDSQALTGVGLAGDCTAATNANQAANCLLAAGDTAINEMVDLEFADPTVTDTMADQPLARCQQALAKAASKYGSSHAKALAKCLALHDKGNVASCPDSKTNAKRAKLLDKMERTVDARCTNAQAAALSALAAPGWSCDGSASTTELADCQSSGHDAAVDTLLATLP